MSETKKEITSVKDVTIVHEGTQIILPVIKGKPMGYDEGIEWLQRKKKEDEAEVGVHNILPCSPMDGAVALQKAIASIYGWSQGVPTPGFFGDTPPFMVRVETGVNESVQVPFGRIQIPGIEGHLQTGIQTEPHLAFVIGGKVKKKHAKAINEIVDLAREILKTDSIYKGKAVKVAFDYLDEDGDRVRDYDPLQDSPKFMDLGSISDDSLIFGEKVLKDIEIGLFTPIEQTAACREFGVPLKRGILLYGPYGTGKTMTAYVAALKAARNGWTFVYLDKTHDLKMGLQFAAQYAPCVIFAEDIDRAMHGDRSYQIDDILNTLDGVDTKGAEIITVLTTNHIENINPAMLRMGRLDTLVEVTAPDAKAAERLVKLYARGLLDEKADLKKIGIALAGKIPAFIREVTERAKIAAIGRTDGGNIKGKVLQEDLLAAASAMETHENFLKPKESNVIEGQDIFVKASKGSKVLLANNNTN
ncbi:MAG: ATP-binding protein [Sterolibacterium sp.]